MSLSFIIFPHIVEKEIHIAGKILLNLLGAFFSTVCIASLLHYFITYTFTENYLILNSPVQKKQQINYQDIIQLQRLSNHEAYGFWNKRYVKELEARANMDLSTYFEEGKKHKEVLSYCSLTPRHTETGSNDGMYVSSYNIKVSGDYFILKLTNDKIYLLTPAKADEFESFALSKIKHV